MWPKQVVGGAQLQEDSGSLGLGGRGHVQDVRTQRASPHATPRRRAAALNLGSRAVYLNTNGAYLFFMPHLAFNGRGGVT